MSVLGLPPIQLPGGCKALPGGVKAPLEVQDLHVATGPGGVHLEEELLVLLSHFGVVLRRATTSRGRDGCALGGRRCATAWFRGFRNGFR